MCNANQSNISNGDVLGRTIDYNRDLSGSIIFPSYYKYLITSYFSLFPIIYSHHITKIYYEFQGYPHYIPTLYSFWVPHWEFVQSYWEVVCHHVQSQCLKSYKIPMSSQNANPNLRFMANFKLDSWFSIGNPKIFIGQFHPKFQPWQASLCRNVTMYPS